MKKNKSNEFIKISAASILSIGLFSAAFIGINSLSFAAAANMAESQPSAAVSAIHVLRAGIIPPKDYKKPEITIYECPEQYYEKSVNALPMYEAAEIGAQYIWEVLGESIDGKTVEMYYAAIPCCTRSWWTGAVADTKAELANHEAQFRFIIDAVSGERIDISQALAYGSTIDSSKLHEIPFNDLPSLMAETPDNLDEYTQIAKEYAQKHFNHSKVTDAVFEKMSVLSISRGKSKDLLTVAFTEKTLIFKVTDNTGREAEVMITADTKQLFYLETQDNDIVPGFNAEVPGGLG